MKRYPLAPVARTIGKPIHIPSPAAESVADCDKALDRAGRNWKLAEKAGILDDTTVPTPPIPADCFSDEFRDSQIHAMRGLGRFAGRSRATQHADAMATLARRGFARFTRFVSYRQAFADLIAFPAMEG